MDFTIWFIGFIAHVTLGGSAGERAVFVRPDVQHKVVLTAFKADVLEGTTLPYTVVNNEAAQFDLTGEQLVLTVPGQSGAVTRKPSFLEHVAPLSLLTDGKPIAKVKAKVPLSHKRVLGYLDYSGGCLTAHAVKIYEISFHDADWPDPHLLAHQVQYTAAATGPVEFVSRKSGKKIVLKAAAAIRVENTARNKQAHYFADYNWILDGDEIADLDWKEQSALNEVPIECPGGSPPLLELYPSVPDIECTNSRYP
ncbi:MAG TPA: hypothetical protein VM733_07470 [Thermoanaerobaculia bacterium]|nr:hypothetical protein [Thermoanaerobaculia bacterium]